MFDLLVVGGLGVDIPVRVPELPLPAADSIIVPPFEPRIGNTGAGVALAAEALGLRVALVDVIGEDASGEVVRAALARTTIHHVLRTDPRGTRRSVLLLDPAGGRTSLHDPRGPWTGPPPFAPEELTELVGAAAHVHLSIMDWALGLLPGLPAGPATSPPVSTDLHDWDGRNDYHRPFAAAADLVFVSGAALGDRAERMARELITDGRPRTAVVTLGARGALLVGADGPLVRVPAAGPPAPVRDSTGAGDAFVAGYVAAARSPGTPPAEAAGYAARVAAAACTHDGLEYPAGLLPPLVPDPGGRAD
ncbi:carbohydrate kinase family protein [Plantactinospora sp. S1510]|uniref:Carbohydrate kinase family protein n=1 Tax=Plantactinospora alkalitolerans TaxID=2789879 RepID=A0ABS0GYI3_9ACTN|nr:carbohydrate kinase family protein [Plantactinospora alkalitolerans]MBF9131144.1 carbohydrate kinase family protein [Plantactinospora alkalitolerans]